jgi:hypothetical protein
VRCVNASRDALLDQRIRACFNGVLMNLHLVLVPFFQRHTAVKYVTMIKTVMNVSCPTWNDKLISIASDGENTMTGRTGGGVILLERQCTNPVLRVWCVPHQLDLVIKTTTVGVDDGEFYKAAHAFSVHLRAQHNLIVAMDGAKCPKGTTQWVAFGNMLKCIIQHRRRLRKHVLYKRPVQAPTDNWWILAASLLPVFETLATTHSQYCRRIWSFRNSAMKWRRWSASLQRNRCALIVRRVIGGA